MRTDRVLQLLRAACEKAGGQSAWGRAHGIKQQYVSAVLSGDRPPGPRILAALDLEATTTTTYSRKASADAE
jgi:hypothetical protein